MSLMPRLRTLSKSSESLNNRSWLQEWTTISGILKTLLNMTMRSCLGRLKAVTGMLKLGPLVERSGFHMMRNLPPRLLQMGEHCRLRKMPPRKKFDRQSLTRSPLFSRLPQCSVFMAFSHFFKLLPLFLHYLLIFLRHYFLTYNSSTPVAHNLSWVQEQLVVLGSRISPQSI